MFSENLRGHSMQGGLWEQSWVEGAPGKLSTVSGKMRLATGVLGARPELFASGSDPPCELPATALSNHTFSDLKQPISLKVLEVRGPKPKCWRGYVLFREPNGECVPLTFWSLEATQTPCPHHSPSVLPARSTGSAHLSGLPPSASVL